MYTFARSPVRLSAPSPFPWHPFPDNVTQLARQLSSSAPLAGSSRISGFHKLDQDERLAAVQDNTGITDAQVELPPAARTIARIASRLRPRLQP